MTADCIMAELAARLKTRPLDLVPSPRTELAPGTPAAHQRPAHMRFPRHQLPRDEKDRLSP